MADRKLTVVKTKNEASEFKKIRTLRFSEDCYFRRQEGGVFLRFFRKQASHRRP